jgi:hypothetical protein
MVTKPKPKVEFKPNMPVQLALSYSEGKIVSGRFGEQVMYSLADGRVMYLNFKVAEKINELELNVREPFFVCKYCPGRKGTHRIGMSGDRMTPKRSGQMKRWGSRTAADHLQRFRRSIPGRPGINRTGPS